MALHRLSGITVWYPYPLPLVLPALEKLQEAQLFMKQDLRSAHNLVHIQYRQGTSVRWFFDYEYNAIWTN